VLWKHWKFEKATKEPSVKRRKIASKEEEVKMQEIFSKEFVDMIVALAMDKYPDNAEFKALNLKTRIIPTRKSLKLKTVEALKNSDSKEVYKQSLLDFFMEGVIEGAPGPKYKQMIDECDDLNLKTKLECWYIQWNFMSGKLGRSIS
jgi:hypothetical protein